MAYQKIKSMIVAVKSEYLTKTKVEEDARSSHKEKTIDEVRNFGFLVLQAKYFKTFFA